MKRDVRTRGFTLLEMSIVLTVVALVVGGLLVGQDLLGAGAVRSQIAQINQYNSAVHAFENKYGALPGDLPAVAAQRYGFTPRGVFAGEGDGDGELRGIINHSCCGVAVNDVQSAGETVMFWVDLTAANGLHLNLIDGTFDVATPDNPPTLITQPDIPKYLPNAKIGRGNFVYVWSPQGLNSFGIAALHSIPSNYTVSSTIPVIQAYSIDRKVDDGMPTTGTVTTQVTMGLGNSDWVGQNNNIWPTLPSWPIGPTSSTCFDNGNVASAPFVYSTSVNNGAGPNCALAVQFQ